MDVAVWNEEIREFNLTYLLIAQRLIKEDRDGAMLRLNIDAESADFLAAMTTKQITSLASANQLLVSPCFDAPARLADVLDNQRDRGLTGTHVAMLLASAKPASVLRSAAEEDKA